MSDEVDALRQENEQLRGQLRSARSTRLRSAAAAVLSVVTALVIVLAVVASWTTGTALNTTKFVDRVGPIIDEPEVRTAISVELGNQLVAVLDVETRLRTALPDKLGFLSVPLASSVEDVVRKQVTTFVDSPAFKRIWIQSLTVAHSRAVKSLTGSTSNVQIVNGKVVVDLIGVTRQVLAELPASVQAVVGNGLASQIPDNVPVDQLRGALSRYLGVSLPEGFAQIPVMDSSALESARTGVRVLNLSVLLVVLLALVLLALTLGLSPNRRRTLVQLGLWTAGVTAVVFFAVREVNKAFLAGISDDIIRPAAADAVRVIFDSLRSFAALLFWLSLVLALVAYLVGPGRLPKRLRGLAAAGAHRSHDTVGGVVANEDFRAWVTANLDALRVGGLVVAALVLVLWSGWTAFLVVGGILVAFEIGVTVLSQRTAGQAELES